MCVCLGNGKRGKREEKKNYVLRRTINGSVGFHRAIAAELRSLCRKMDDM